MPWTIVVIPHGSGDHCHGRQGLPGWHLWLWLSTRESHNVARTGLWWLGDPGTQRRHRGVPWDIVHALSDRRKAQPWFSRWMSLLSRWEIDQEMAIKQLKIEDCPVAGCRLMVKTGVRLPDGIVLCRPRRENCCGCVKPCVWHDMTWLDMIWYDRRKFRSQTSDNMDWWKSRGGKSQRGEENQREDQRR